MGADKLIYSYEASVNAVMRFGDTYIISAAGNPTINKNLRGYNCTLKVWNCTTGAIEQTLTGHEDQVTAVAVLDHQLIVSASEDHTLKVWNLATSNVIASIKLDAALYCLAFVRQKDRNLVVAGGRVGALYCLELVEPMGE